LLLAFWSTSRAQRTLNSRDFSLFVNRRKAAGLQNQSGSDTFPNGILASAGWEVTMAWYSYAKFFHIAFVSIWIGAGVCLLVLAFAAMRARDDAELIRIVRNAVYLSMRLFVPTSLLTFLSGLVMLWLAHSFRDLWVVLGLAGFAATFLTGILVLKPGSEKIALMFEREGVTAGVVAESRDFLRHFAFDYVMLFLVVAVMVLKPTGSDRVLLAAMALILAGAMWMFLARRRGATLAQA
jgi:uncharacterized membrane protein